MGTTFKLYADKMGATDPSTYIGREGDIFYNQTTGSLRISDGSTPGGISILDGGGSGGISNVVEDTTPQLGGALDTNGNNITFGDNDKAVFGAGSDLQIYHNGSNSTIKDASTGVLEIQTNGTEVQITGNSGTDYMARFINNGAVNLYYDHAIKLATTATGVDVTGNIVVSGTVDGRDVAADGTKLDGIETGATADQTITAGSGLTGGGTGDVTLNVGAGSYITVAADTVSVDATSANTVSKVVARDASGNFSAGTITAALSGNATTATALQTARNIALTGAVTGNANFDGTGNISITTTATSDPTLTINGDASGSATFTNLGNATLTLTIADDSHNHVISNVDGLQTALDAKAPLASPALTGTATAVNLTLSGNLTVNGTTTTLNTTNTVVSDNLIELNNGVTSNANDSGIVIERGTTGDNAFIGWDESADSFILGTTTATGSSTGNLTITPGTLNIGTLQIGGTSVTSTAAELNLLDGVTATTAEINYLDGVTSNIQTQLNAKGTLSNVVEDTTPQLGGDLDTNGNQIHGGTAQNDAVYISGAYGANDGNVWLSGVVNGGSGGTVNVAGTNGGSGGTVNINYGGNNGYAYGTTYIGSIASVAGFDNAVHIVNSQWPQSRGSSGQVLSTNGSGTLSWVNNGGGLSVLSTKTLDNPNAYSTSANDYFGHLVAISGNYAIVGAQFEDDAGGTSSGKVYIFDVPSGSLLYTLDNPNAYSTSANDRFGVSVAISGNYAIVGAFLEDDAGGSNSGKAYIYDISTFSSSTITSANYVLDNPNAYGTRDFDNFGFSVAISGNYAIVGAWPEGDAGGLYSGKAYIYDISTFTSSTISSANYVLDNPNAYGTSTFDSFGYSVAISGNYAIVGAYSEGDAGGSGSGKAYVYDISTFTSSTISSANYVLDNPNAYGTGADDQFGYSVAISGNYAIVSAHREDDAGGADSGKAYIYDISTFSSSTITSANYTLDNPNAYSTSANDLFGFSVAISGNYAIVGAYGEGDAGGGASGKAYIYDIAGFSSSTITSADYVLDNPNAYSTSASDNFGYSVSISGNYAIVGAQFEDDAGGAESGKAYIFKTNGEAYTYTPQEINSFTPSRIFPNIEVAGITEKLATDTNTSGTHIIYCAENSGRSTYFTNSFTANRTLNVKDISNQVYQNGSVTVSVIHNTGSGSYAFTTFLREGASITPIWAGGSAPTYSANKWVIVTLTFIWLGSSWGQTFASFNEFG